MIAEISSLVGLYEPNSQTHRSLYTALHFAYAGDWIMCESALRYAKSAAPRHLKGVAAEQINPIIDAVDALLSARRRVEKAYE